MLEEGLGEYTQWRWQEVLIEEADGSSSGQKEYDLVVLVHGNMWSGGGGVLYFGHPVLGRMSQKDAWMNQIFEVQTWRQVRGPAGAVMCETRDLVIKWPHSHPCISRRQKH